MTLGIFQRYVSYLRSGHISELRGGAWFARKEQAKFLLAAGLALFVASQAGWQSPLGISLIGVAVLIALSGTAFVMWTVLSVGARAGDKRYNMFTRKKLSSEYRDTKDG